LRRFNLLKSDLVEIVKEKFNFLDNKESEKLVNLFFSEIVASLSEGKRIELRGFGSFSIKTRLPRVARNPKTGEKVEVGTKLMPHFRAGKDLNKLINS